MEQKLKTLLKQTESNKEDNFGGVIFVTFNSLEGAEKFLENFPKILIMNIIYY